jgi:hypothetical protein
MLNGGLEVDMKIRFIRLAAVCILSPTLLLAQPAGKKTIVGVWEVKMAPVGQSQAPLLSLAMYGRDGSFNAAGDYQARPPVAAVQEVGTELSPGYGRWAATGDRGIQLTFYSTMWKAGLANGFQRVQDTLFLSESGDEYTGHAQVDFLDENWNVVFSTISDVKGTRLEIPIAALLEGQAAAKERLSGVWELKMSPVGQSQSPLLGLAMYGGDGGFITAGGYKALPPISAVQDVATELGPGYGGWVATGEGQIQLAFYSVMWKAGLVNGYQRVRDTLVLSESGDEYTGHPQLDFLDTSWKVVFSTKSDVKATRLETPISAMADARPGEKKDLVGIWAIRVRQHEAEYSAHPHIDIFSADGSLSNDTDRRLSWGMIGSGRGRWAATSARVFQLKYYAVTSNKEGVASGFERVQSTLTLSEAGDEFTGRSKWDLFDANWTVVFKGFGDFKGTRLETLE